MTLSLLDCTGQRKYLTPGQRADFIKKACYAEPETSSFCLTLALTGARISEVLALTPDRVDAADCAVVFETLKRRRRGIYRSVPVPYYLIEQLLAYMTACGFTKSNHDQRLWNFSRTTAWQRVKVIMHAAHIPASIAKPKALRHAFAVEAVQKKIALSMVQKWLGHAKIETTAIYADPTGEEERALARLMWHALPLRRHEGKAPVHVEVSSEQ
jgi:integrase/recombinase XerD